MFGLSVFSVYECLGCVYVGFAMFMYTVVNA